MTNGTLIFKKAYEEIKSECIIAKIKARELVGDQFKDFHPPKSAGLRGRLPPKAKTFCPWDMGHKNPNHHVQDTEQGTRGQSTST